MKAYYLFELQSFFRNKKNLATIVFLLVALFYYLLVSMPSEEPTEQVDEAEIRLEYEEMTHWLENRQGEGLSPGVSFALGYFPPLVEIDERRLEALDEEDMSDYAEATADWYQYQDEWIFNHADFLSYNRAYYGVDQDYPRYEGRYWYLETANRYQAYAKEVPALSVDILEERTAVQTGYRLLNQSIVPFLLIGLIIVFANDIVLKDRQHLSLVRSFPLSMSQKLWVKTAVILSSALAVVLTVFLLGYLWVGLQNGFGSFSTPVSVFEGPLLLAEQYQTISVGQFYMQALGLFLVMAFVVTRFILLCSLVIRNDYFNLLIGVGLFFVERLYYMRGIGSFTHVDLLPFTFFPIGQVLSGYQNHLYNSDSITFTTGIGSFLATAVLIEGILLLISRHRSVRSFI